MILLFSVVNKLIPKTYSMETSSKSRTPSRCREWERQRRNKFNEAITKLGEAVRAINKANNPSDKEADNAQYPKIEIVQKAIVCLTNCAQEKTQLKAEILALQVKIDSSKQTSESKKDASTQVHTSFSKKAQNGKYVKLLMLQKSKRNALKEKSILTTNATVEEKTRKGKLKADPPPQHTPPKILPKTSLNDKKRTENTIVVLPAAPYLFPQRPLFLPAVPPAFVIVDPNMQSLNKTSVPIVNRAGGDTTKTTMVNILPISAYSRPLSATKVKKSNCKPKTDISKKNKKKSITPKTSKEPVNNNKANTETDVTNQKIKETLSTELPTEKSASDIESKCSKEPINKSKSSSIDDNNVNGQKKKEDNSNDPHNKETGSTSKVEQTSNTTTFKNGEKVNLNETHQSLAQTIETNQNEILKEANMPVKSTSAEDKDKENKLPNILDTTLCESGVDGGNARLELAEEFLAASPTAAFLMSFPLVSGNRADSPAEDTPHTIQGNVKDNTQIAMPPAPTDIYFEKSATNNNDKTKAVLKQPISTTVPAKQPVQHKYLDNNVLSKSTTTKTTSSVAVPNTSNENPFLTLPMPSLITTTTQSDTFGLDFDCNISKSISSQSTYAGNNNLFYKSDPFNTVKSTIYSTSSIASGHEFNSLGLYPCAMEKYGKNKSDYTNVEDNLMKIGSSRLTYDIDLGWSHKGFDFVNCTTNSNTFSKDILTTATAPSYSTSYNPFNPEFHVPLVTTSNKKDATSKPMSSFADTITSFYSTPQPANLWSDEMCFYNNTSASKTFTNKHQNYLHLDHTQTNTSNKSVVTKQYETKTVPDINVQNISKPPNETIRQQLPDKYSKKSPNKMHINWMTSELRPMQNNCNPAQTEMKEPHKQPYGQVENSSKKQDQQNEGNYFPISMHNFSAQPAQEDFQVWPSARPLGTTEISIEPPPINLPTLVGDLALGPHDKKKNADLSNRIGVQPDIQNCGNFLSVTQLMNRSSDNATSRYHGPTTETPKPATVKQSNAQFVHDINRKAMPSRVESNLSQPCYVFNDLKHSYENVGQFSHSNLSKPKTNKSDKNVKVHKHSYSAEALIRSGNGTQKVQDQIGPKFTPSQKYGDYNISQDTSVAQVSHFPPMLDYSDNGYTGQQFSGTTLYNSTTNTISNSFYSNFMSGSANIMSGSYSTAPFTGDFMDYNQAECNYTNNKYEEFKMRSNPAVFQDKVPSNYKSSRRESGTKHKLECSKKESKKYQNKRAKVSSEAEEWSDANLFWQNKGQSKKHGNVLAEELSFANYMGNGVAPQYQHELFNSHLVGVQPAERLAAAFPATSRANFNLSTIFPEITMKVQ